MHKLQILFDGYSLLDYNNFFPPIEYVATNKKLYNEQIVTKYISILKATLTKIDKLRF